MKHPTNVIDLAMARAIRSAARALGARRDQHLGRLRRDRHTPIRIVPPSAARVFARYDTVEDKASGRRGIVAGIIGPDRYDVMFYMGQADDAWRVTRWGYQLSLIMTGEQTLARALGDPQDRPPTPPPSAA